MSIQILTSVLQTQVKPQLFLKELRKMGELTQLIGIANYRSIFKLHISISDREQCHWYCCADRSFANYIGTSYIGSQIEKKKIS